MSHDIKTERYQRLGEHLRLILLHNQTGGQWQVKQCGVGVSLAAFAVCRRARWHVMLFVKACGPGLFVRFEQ